MAPQAASCKPILIAACNLKSRLAGRLLSDLLRLFFKLLGDAISA